MEVSLAYLIHSRARHSAKPTGYEKNIEHMRRQAPQQASRAGGITLAHSCCGAQAGYAVFQFPDSA